MDRYKKTSLKFDRNLGYGRNLRTVEINNSRAVARNTRFSMQRCLEDEVEDSENQPKSKIATLGKQTLKAPVTRLEMLQKWKEEKLMKQKMELKNKKPTFKLGLVPPKSIPVFTTFNKTDSRISSIKDSKISYNVTNTSKMMKETCPKPPLSGKSQALPSNSMKPSKSKEFQIKSSNLKPPVNQFSNLKVKKESHLQVPNKPKTGLQKPSFVSSKDSSKQIKNEEIQAPMKSQVVQSKASFTATKAKSKMQLLSAVPKPAESKILKKPEQVQLNTISRRNQNRIPEPKTNQLQNSNRTLLKGPSKTTAQTKQTGIPNKTGTKPKQESTCHKKNEESPDSNITFSCEISHIEPAEERKSFAPKDFMFNPGAEFSFSFLEEGPMAIYNKLKAGGERTSTPKRKEIIEIQEEEAEKCSSTTESGPEIKPVTEIPEIQDTTNTSFYQTTCSSQIKLSEEKRPISIVANSSDAVKEQKSRLLDDISNITKESKVNRSHEETHEKSCNAIKTSPEGKAIEENSKPENSVTSLPDGLSVIEESPISSFATASASSSSGDLKENTPGDDVFVISPKEFETFEQNGKNCSVAPDDLKKGVDLVSSTTQEPVASLCEEKKFVFEENGALLMAGTSSDSVQQKKIESLESGSGIISRRRPVARNGNASTRGNRRSEMPLLESINESIENSSLQESPPKPPKSRKSTRVLKDFTPRRSSRLASLSGFDTTENLFNVRPSLCDTPPDIAGTSSATNITYDFDRLHLESASEQPTAPQRRMSTRNGKVSLLYTPPQKGRVSSVRKSVKGDLMSFSPDV